MYSMYALEAIVAIGVLQSHICMQNTVHVIILMLILNTKNY